MAGAPNYPNYPSFPTFLKVLNIWFLAGYITAPNKDYISQPTLLYGSEQIWYMQLLGRALKGLGMLFSFSFFPNPGRNADVMVRSRAAFMDQELKPCIEDGRAKNRWNWDPWWLWNSHTILGLCCERNQLFLV